MVSQDRYGLLTNLKKILNISSINDQILTTTTSLEHLVNSSNDENNDNDSDMSTDDNQQFILDIPYDVYRKMKPLTTEHGYGYKKRKYNVLKQGVWSNIIYDAFFKSYRFPCSYVFKRCKVYYSDSAKYFLTFNATCKDESCKSTLKGVANKQPLEDQPLKIIISTKDTRSIPHNNMIKRHLNGEKRIEVGNDLRKSTSNICRRSEMRKECEFGEIIPPNIYGGPVLR